MEFITIIAALALVLVAFFILKKKDKKKYKDIDLPIPDHKDVPYTGLEAQSEEQQALWRKAGNICLNKE